MSAASKRRSGGPPSRAARPGRALSRAARSGRLACRPVRSGTGAGPAERAASTRSSRTASANAVSASGENAVAAARTVTLSRPPSGAAARNTSVPAGGGVNTLSPSSRETASARPLSGPRAEKSR